jgi:hypothetical protein
MDASMLRCKVQVKHLRSWVYKKEVESVINLLKPSGNFTYEQV